MDLVNRKVAELEERSAAAAELCVRAKALDVCSVCDTVFAPRGRDAAAAYALGAELVVQNAQLVAAFRGDLVALRLALDELIADTSEQCECPTRG